MYGTIEKRQPAYQKMRALVVKWGRPLQFRLRGPAEGEWMDYAVAPGMRGTTHGGTITLRWERYDVRHEHVNARWKVAVDPYGRIWVAKADTY